jgi:hypothetical protein
MKTLRMRKIDPIATVFCSRRFENGVEIFEKETHQVVTVNAREDSHTAPTEARLVIGDAISSATKLFIAKTRSEIGGLDALLKTLTGPELDPQ